MRLSNKLAKIIFASATFLLLSLACILYFQFTDLISSSNKVNRTNLVKLKLEKVLSNLKDAETAQRGFLLSKDSVFLNPYFGTRETTEATIKEIDDLFKDQTEQQKNLNILASYIAVRFNSFNNTIKQYNNPDLQSTARKYLLLKNKESMDQIREHCSKMIALEESLLIKREETAAKHLKLTPFYALLLILTALAIIVFSYAKLIEELNKSRKYQKALEILNTELHKKNTALEIYNKELDSFAYIASHDLREPLRKIQLFTTVIQTNEEKLLSEKSMYNIHRIQQSVKRMQKLLNDLLHYSHYTQSNENVFESVSLSLIIKDVEENLKEIIEENNVTIEKKHLPYVTGMPFQLRQLFENLISNSIKFRIQDIQPRIIIEAKLVKANEMDKDLPAQFKSYYKIIYKDNGIGFDAMYSEKVFGLFQKLDTSEKHGGTGIGLTICKKIIHNHEGFIKVYSEENKGTRFDIYLPI